MSGLPQKWSRASLADIASLKTGPFGSSLKKSDYVNGQIPVVNPMHIEMGRIRPTNDMTVSRATADRLAEFLLRKGDVVVGRRGEMGRCAVVTDKEHGWLCGSGSFIVRPGTEINSRYLQRFLSSPDVVQRLLASSVGSTMVNLNQKIMKSLLVPVPPLAEQQHIADKLDVLLGRVDACRARLERVPAVLKRLRQAVLAAATSGRLTEEWREENTRFTSEWKDFVLGDLIERIEAGINYQCDERPPEPHEKGLVKISAVTWGTYDDEESKTLPSNIDVPEHTRIKQGDLLISRANTLELVGACVIVEQVNRPVYLSDKVLRLRIKDELKKWVLYWLRSSVGRNQIEALASGNQLSMRNISQANLKQISLSLPQSEERLEIVRRVEALFAYADRLEARYAAAREQVEQLTPSLLAKAFRGELVAQE